MPYAIFSRYVPPRHRTPKCPSRLLGNKMNTLAGKKRPREEYFEPPPSDCKCNLCNYYCNQLLNYIQQLNDRIMTMNALIEDANNRYNERGKTLSYIS